MIPPIQTIRERSMRKRRIVMEGPFSVASSQFSIGDLQEISTKTKEIAGLGVTRNLGSSEN
jgi:hypothetical protein